MKLLSIYIVLCFKQLKLPSVVINANGEFQLLLTVPGPGGSMLHSVTGEPRFTGDG
jgi:hypothetical protein